MSWQATEWVRITRVGDSKLKLLLLMLCNYANEDGESWYSQELHEVVLRKRSDPRSGESVYRLTDIRRGEPDASLFQVPGGYKTSTEPVMEFKRRTAPKE